MVVAIGSLRPPKVEAVRTVVSRVAPFMGFDAGEIEYYARDVQSGISAMPMTMQEIMQGAYNRAHDLQMTLRSEGKPADFFIGLEGGVFRRVFLGNEGTLYLQSWVYVADNEKGFFGSSPAITVPERIAAELRFDNKELGDVIDKYSAEENTREKGGAYATFTRGLLQRQNVFELALICALAPFYRPDLYAP